MRSCLFLAIGLCAALHAQPAGMTGTVVHAITGEPLRGVHITLYRAPNAAYGATSDQAGRFSIGSMDPGLYTVLPQLRGFLLAGKADAIPAGTAEITLKPGQQLTDYRLTMTPSAAIAGRVVDENGDPVQNVEVRPITNLNGSNSMPWWQNWSDSSDERGEFRVTVIPGKYYLRAALEAFGAGSRRTIVREDGAPEPQYALTYYPSSAGVSRAEAVEAAPGSTVRVEIRLARSRSLIIAGTVAGVPEGPGGAMVFLEPLNTQSVAMNTTFHDVGPDGKFAFPNLPSGYYRLFARGFGETRLQSQIQPLHLDDADATNVALVLVAGQELSGVLEIADDPLGPAAAKGRSVRLEPERQASGWVEAAEVDATGRFRITGIFPGRYRIHVDPLPANDFIKSVQLDGAAVSGGLLDLTRGGPSPTASIVVAHNGGQVSGHLLDESGAPLVNRPAALFFLQNPENFQFEDMTRVIDGKYALNGIAPGKYRLFAVADWDGNPKSAIELAAKAGEIEIHANDRIVKDLKLMVTEAADAKQDR
jgi:hypothetical protein